jgi:hypothetical protein
MNHDQITAAVAVGMGIIPVRGAMRGPSGMPEAGVTGHPDVFVHRLFQVHQFPGSPELDKLSLILINRTSRIVAAILQAA